MKTETDRFVSAILVLAVLIGGFLGYWTVVKERPKREVPKITLPSSEQIGEGTGKITKGFTKGFVKGIFKGKEE